MVNFGVAIFATDYAIQPAELARAVEERGFESLFFTEHTHIPTSRRTPFPGGGEIPREYSHTYDPFVTLAVAAAVTERIKLGTAVCLIPEHDPIVLAKTVASLDVISNGRLIFGVGGGWNVEEMGNHGVAFKDRWRVTRERILAMRTIWTQDEPEFHGEFVDFDPLWSYPKPVQPNGPPILLGTESRWAYDRVVEYCDGWMPIGRRGDLRAGMEQLRAAASRGGRQFESLDLTVFGVEPDADHARELIDIGFRRLLFRLPSAPAASVVAKLDQYAALARTLS